MSTPEITPEPKASMENAPEVVPPKPKYNDFQRLLGTLLYPSEVFHDLNIKPSFFIPLAIFTLVSIFSTFLVIQRVNVNWEAIYSKSYDDQLAKQGKSRADLSKEEREAIDTQLKTAAKIAPYISYASTIILPTAISLILALIFFGGVSLMGGTTIYTKVLALVIHIFAMMTIFFQAPLNMLVLFLKDPSEIDLTKGSLIATSPAALMPEKSSIVLTAILSQFDIFTIWSLILLSIGLPAISKNLSKQLAAVTVFGLWSLYAVVSVALKILFS